VLLERLNIATETMTQTVTLGRPCRSRTIGCSDVHSPQIGGQQTYLPNMIIGRGQRGLIVSTSFPSAEELLAPGSGWRVLFNAEVTAYAVTPGIGAQSLAAMSNHLYF